jgi:DNA-binding MarR family transcriptional regulator
MHRVPNAEDRRRVDLSLSQPGMELLRTVAPRMHQQASDFHDREFTTTEKSSSLQLLTKVSVALAFET